jgi:hypothetical protein
LKGAAAISALGRSAVHAAVILACLGLGACASEPSRLPSAAQDQVAAPVPQPLGPELSAEPEAAPAPAVAPQPRKPHKVRKPAQATSQVPAPFRCHIVREANLENAAALPPGADPVAVDLYARIDPEARTLAVERVRDPAFTQAKQRCGDGKPSPATIKKKRKRNGRARPYR